ncbi:MAG: trypsin-like peptidase domain-containing protein [Myxococcota bacterium]
MSLQSIQSKPVQGAKVGTLTAQSRQSAQNVAKSVPTLALPGLGAQRLVKSVLNPSMKLTPGDMKNNTLMLIKGAVPGADLAVQKAFQSAIAKARLSTVSVENHGRSGPQGGGSGVVWDTEGHIVTNHHVIEGATKVVVALHGKDYVAEVVASSADVDLAVLKLIDPPKELKPVSVADYEPEVGQLVIAVGDPLGLRDTVTHGMIGALNRSVSPQHVDTIQVDAPINPVTRAVVCSILRAT